MDSTLTRRIQEGYRVLLVSMCDHDNYAGRGAPYPNNPNPNGGERQVNGLQATMAAMDYTVANYPTTHVFAHGTSAGSLGVFAMSQAYVGRRHLPDGDRGRLVGIHSPQDIRHV